MNAKTKVIRASREYRNATRNAGQSSGWGDDTDEDVVEAGKRLDAALNEMDDEAVASLEVKA